MEMAHLTDIQTAKVGIVLFTFADFGNYNLSPVGNYYVQFESTRYSTGTVAAATLKNIYVTVYYH